MKTLTELLANTVQARSEHELLWERGAGLPYGELWHRAGGFARWLRAGRLQEQDRVAILLPNGRAYLTAYFGTLLARGIAVGLNPDTTVEELAWVLRHCTPAVLVATRTHRALVHRATALADCSATIVWATDKGLLAADSEPIESDEPPSAEHWPVPDDIAQIIYTSGTSGRPKGVTLSHRNLVANTRSIVQYLKLGPTDSVFVILPFFYSYGNSLLLTHVAAGGRLILAPDFVFLNRALDVMEQQGATGFSGVPSSYAMLIHRSDFLNRSFPTLRYLTCAGGGLARSLVRRIREAFPHVELYLMYGQTEASARLSSLMPDELDRKPGSIGRGIPGVTLRVLDDGGRPVAPGQVGEIVARGENIMVGYWNDPEGTAAVLRPEGLRTGDLATVDEDGYIYVVGRKSDLIKSGAYRIHPREIEEVILELDGVAEVAVVGLPDEMLGEAPVAFVVRSERSAAVSADDIIRHCAARLPRYKRIHRVVFVDELPKTSTGKVRRQLLRERELAGTAS